MSEPDKVGYQPGIPPEGGSDLGKEFDSFPVEAPMAKVFPGQIILADNFDGWPGQQIIVLVGVKAGYTVGEPDPDCFIFNPWKQTIEVMAYKLSPDFSTLFSDVYGWVRLRKDQIVEVHERQGKSTDQMLQYLSKLQLACSDEKRQITGSPTWCIAKTPPFDGG
jgi:hypothetical protein